MDEFRIHPQLRADCHVLGQLNNCRILLHRNAGVPWYIVVPESDAGELHALDAGTRETVTRVIDDLARFVKAQHGSERVNVAAIGNRVPQLHIHVVGRSEGDPCWPDVVWGNLPAGPKWSAMHLTELQQALQEAFGSDAFTACETAPG